MRGAAVLPALAFAAASAAAAAGPDDAAIYQPLLTALEEIRTRYVDEAKASPASLRATALEGIAQSLDAESLLLPEKPQGGPAGVGLTIGVKDGVPLVLDVVEGGPADLAGVKPADRLLRVNGETVYGKKRPEVEWMLSGPAGASVAVMWATPDGEYEEAACVRSAAARPAWRRVRLPAVDLFQVFRLDAGAAADLKKALADAGAGAVLDLRSAAGGDPDAALALADACLPPGVLLAAGKGAGAAAVRRYESGPKAAPLTAPLVLLAGPRTQGAAEILAAALKEHKRAVVVGARTFGFAGRQKEFAVGEGGSRRARLTVERFLGPGLVSLTGTGVGADLSSELVARRDVSKDLERKGVPALLVRRLLERPPATFDSAALAAGRLELGPRAAKGKSVAEQRGEFEEAFAVALESVLRARGVEVERESLDAQRQAMISRVRVLLARERMTSDAAVVVALEEDPEVDLAQDTLRALRTLGRARGG